MRAVLLLLFVQMLGTITPLFLFPAETFTIFPFVPTLEGQYIIKNVVIVAAAIVLGATVRGGELSPEPVVATTRAQRVTGVTGRVTVTAMLPTARTRSKPSATAHRRHDPAPAGDGERSVGELAGSMPISRPAVSRHLRLLREAGLVKERAVGTRRLYALDDLGAEAVRDYLESVWGDAVARFRIVAENTRPSGGRRR